MTNTCKYFFAAAAMHIAFLFAGASSASGQATVDKVSQTPLQVKVIAGLPGVDPNAQGKLSIGAASIEFADDTQNAVINRKLVLSATSGDERVETGGKAGKVARVLPPYGSGLALGAVTHKKVDLLTIEYLDGKGEYHGAVFLVTDGDLPGALQQLASRAPEVSMPQPIADSHCSAMEYQASSVRVEAIGADVASAFPPEDRALLYETLIAKLSSEKSVEAAYRAGDGRAAAKCARFTVTVKAETFAKGDQAVRAAVGPLGHFVGATKLTYHLTVTTQNGNAVVDEELKTKEGSDTDSLNITKAISKAVSKNIKKTAKQLRQAESE